jgi:protein ImuB
MFGVVYAAEGCSSEALLNLSREFSPRLEVCGAREVVIDLSGLERLFGDARTIAGELRRTAADRGLRVRVAIAGTRTAARLLVHHRAGVTVVEPGDEAAALAPLPLSILRVLLPEPEARSPKSGDRRPETGDRRPETDVLLTTVRRWGLSTLGDFVALPPDDVSARLGQHGVAWQRLAAGADPRPLLPAVPEERFEQALALEWPIDGLEPLSFVLGRLMEPLEAHLARRDRGAAVLYVRLHLVDRTVHERSLQLPAPIRDARTLRTLALLDLESHPPAAAIDRVIVAVDPTPGRVVQFSLLTRPLPSPEQLSTLMARLNALMGEGRCGSPMDVDSWQPGAFAMKPFAPVDADVLHSHEPRRHGGTEVSFVQETQKDLRVSESPWFVAAKHAAPAVALRRFRFPVPARVRVEEGKPARVTTDRRGLGGGRVEMCAGPWRTSGAWWMDGASGAPWDRDEWEVTLTDGATYRIFRERDTDHWYLEGIVD